MGSPRNHILTAKRKAILALLRENGPQPALALARQLNSMPTTTRNNLRYMLKANLVHVDHFETFAAGRERPVYAAGLNPDAPTLAPLARQFTIRCNEILAALKQHKRLTVAHCESLLGYEHEELRRPFQSLHRRGLIYIADWKHHWGRGGRPSGAFSIGAKPDAPRPKHDLAAARRRCRRKARALREVPLRVARKINPWANLLGEQHAHL